MFLENVSKYDQEIINQHIHCRHFFRNHQISSENSDIFSILSREPSATLGSKTLKIPSQNQQENNTFLENISENDKEIINQHMHC